MKHVKNSQKQKKRLRGLGLVVVLIILVAGILVFWKHHDKPAPTPVAVAPAKTINYSSSKPSDNAANNARKGSKTAAPTLDSSSPASSVPFSVTVTRASVVSSDLQIGTLVNGVTSGSCTVNISQSGQKTVSQTETVQLQNNTYSCPVFDIPVSDFPNRQSWNVSVTVTSNGTSQTSQWQANPVSLSS